jgi:type IV secretion system protein VirB6
MVTICMKMMAAITAAFGVKYLVSMPGLGLSPDQTTDGINSMALQQGGLGILLTTMILSAPLMAAAFFQGTLGQFNAYSPFGHVKPETPGGGGGGGGGPPGSPSYKNAPGNVQHARHDQQNTSTGAFTNQSLTSTGSSGFAPQPDVTKQGTPPGPKDDV